MKFFLAYKPFEINNVEKIDFSTKLIFSLMHKTERFIYKINYYIVVKIKIKWKKQLKVKAELEFWKRA